MVAHLCKRLTNGNKTKLKQALNEVDEAINQWRDGFFISTYDEKLSAVRQGKLNMDSQELEDVYNEETEKAIKENGPEAADWEETHSFVLPEGARWNDVRNVPQNVGKAITAAFRTIENANVDKLKGIFGDGTWTNKKRLPDRLLKDLLEHFSSRTLSLENCPEDELGQGYEFLIRKFADDSGHGAQEFYTNRTVVHLMTEMLKPEPGESIYDPTCGTAGMLISAIAY